MRGPDLLRAIALLTVLFPAAPADAVWTYDVATDVGVCNAPGGQDNSSAVPDGTGGVIVSWEDGRTGAVGIYAQRLDANGVPLWTANGVRLSTVAGLWSDAAPDGAGGAFVSWIHGGLVRVQRLDANGVPQWTADGAPANASPGDQRITSVVADGTGGAFVVWQDYRSGWTYHVYAQHYDAAGNRLWGNGALASAATDWSIAPQADLTPAGNLLVAFHTGNLEASCLSAVDGSSVWPLKAVVAADTVGTSAYWKMVSDGAGGVTLAYLKNSDRVYAGRIDSTGTRAWPTDMPVGTLASAFPIELRESPLHGAYVCWRDTRNGLSGTVAVQHLDGAGSPVWPANGVAVSGAWAAYTGHGFCSDGAGGLLVEWPGPAGLRAQRVDASGALLWPAGGVLVVGAQGTSVRTRVVSDGAGGAIAAYTWFPNLGHGDIRAERVSGSGNPGGPTSAPLPAAAAGASVVAYPNPFRSSTTVELARTSAPAGRVEILDVAGRRVRTLAAEGATGRLTATWDGRDATGRRVPAGVYFARDTAGGATARLVRLR